MDPRERADAALARARARGAYVVTPEDAISPMDAASTLQIPRIVVSSLDQRDNSDPETTMVVPQPHPLAQSQPTQSQPSPRQPRPQPYPPQQHHQQQPHQHPGPPRQQQHPEQEQQPDGMVPTASQPPKQRPTMSQRLDGTL